MSFLYYAEKYYDLGLKPTCISYLKTKYNVTETNPDKSPCHSWRRWQVRNPNFDEIHNLPWNQASGIGTVLGYSNRCIDIDYCTSENLLKEILACLGLPKDYEWAVKTPNGFHIHITSFNIPFISDKELHEGVLALLPNESNRNKFKRIELRWANHAVLPPTIINGIRYDFIYCKDFAPKERPQFVDLNLLFTFLAKYCGKLNPGSGSIIINDIIFELSYPSGSRQADVSAKRISNSDMVLLSNSSEIEIEDNRELIGYWQNPKYIVEYPSNWYKHYLIDQLLFIDVETTGLIKNPIDYDSYPRIIQIAYSSDFGPTTNIYVKPEGFTVPEEIEKLTGLTNDFLNNNGIPIFEALNSIEKKRNSPIIAYNADFDMSILDSEFLRLEKKRLLNNFLRDGSQIFCLMKKINSVFGGKYLKLSEAYELLFKESIPLKAHNAANDLEILIDCYNLMKLYGYIRLGDGVSTLV